MADLRHLRIVYPGLPPEEYSLNSNAHWRAKQQVKKEIQEDIMALLCEATARDQWTGGVMQKARVTYTVTFPVNRRRDDDNLRARFKPLQDALVYWGVLADDSYNVIGAPDIIPLVQKGVSETIIEIQEVE